MFRSHKAYCWNPAPGLNLKLLLKLSWFTYSWVLISIALGSLFSDIGIVGLGFCMTCVQIWSFWLAHVHWWKSPTDATRVQFLDIYLWVVILFVMSDIFWLCYCIVIGGKAYFLDEVMVIKGQNWQVMH